jgi:transcriptional regulator with XRE-family HTH domain
MTSITRPAYRAQYATGGGKRPAVFVRAQAPGVRGREHVSSVRERDKTALSLFADEMKAAREQRGWSQAELAERIPYSLSTISMAEALHRVPTKDFALHLDNAFGTPGTFARLEARLRDLPFPASFRPFAAYEAEATALYVFEHSLIPGLLQTPDYARAVLATRPNTAEDEIDNLVTARLARQAILTREDPPAPLLWALIDEGALHRPVASAEVMYEQLMYLVELSRRPNITVQVVPYSAGGHTGLLGACVIADMDSSPGILYVEDIADGRVFEDPGTVSLVTLRYKSLQSEALPKGASRELIARVAEEQWKGTAP